MVLIMEIIITQNIYTREYLNSLIDFDGVDNGNYNNTKYLHPWISEFSRVSCEEAETYSETIEVFFKRA